jgi:hypothetical protein
MGNVTAEVQLEDSRTEVPRVVRIEYIPHAQHGSEECADEIVEGPPLPELEVSRSVVRHHSSERNVVVGTHRARGTPEDGPLCARTALRRGGRRTRTVISGTLPRGLLELVELLAFALPRDIRVPSASRVLSVLPHDVEVLLASSTASASLLRPRYLSASASQRMPVPDRSTRSRATRWASTYSPRAT